MTVSDKHHNVHFHHHNHRYNDDDERNQLKGTERNRCLTFPHCVFFVIVIIIAMFMIIVMKGGSWEIQGATRCSCGGKVARNLDAD